MLFEGVCLYNLTYKGFAQDLRELIGAGLKALVDKVKRLYEYISLSKAENLPRGRFQNRVDKPVDGCRSSGTEVPDDQGRTFLNTKDSERELKCQSRSQPLVDPILKTSPKPKITDQQYLTLKPAEILSHFTPEVIRKKLEMQMSHSQEQMLTEQKNGKKNSFCYLESKKQQDDSYFEAYGFHSESTTVGGLEVGICHARGLRKEMEDEHLATEFNLIIGDRLYPVQLFGIFDGHGGQIASQFNLIHLEAQLKKALCEFNPNGLTEEGIWHALKKTFVRLHEDFKEQHPNDKTQGTTSTVAMILNNNLWTANVGDSRTILDNNGIPIQMTEDAKPNGERYKKNIEKRGGSVQKYEKGWKIIQNGRYLSVARATGDHHFGEAINPRPKITVKPLSEIDPGSHLILCCDGIYDVSRTSDIVKAVHDANEEGKPTAGDLARNTVYSALQAGSRDNLSALVVKIK